MENKKPGRVEEPLLVAARPENAAAAEAKRLLRLAGPLVASCILQSAVQLVSVMFVGHLGELPLAGASLASSLANVTGFSLLFGMASALDTLCGQAFGAGRRLRAVAHPVPRPLRPARVPHPVPAGAEPRRAGDGQLRRRRAGPRRGVLGAGVQGRHGEQRRRAEQRHLLRRQPGPAHSLRQAVGRVREDMDGILHRGFQRAAPVHSARHPIGDDGLLGVVVI